jgi:murein DD-endopeptidase MepM/ murein hydrolase activator NlpD
MLSGKRTRTPGVPGFIARSLTIAMAIAAAGCSAEVTRFDYNSNKQITGSIPIPDEPVGRGGPPRGLGFSEAPLPPPSDLPPSNGLAGTNYGTNYGSNHAGPPPAGPPSSDPPGNYRVVGRTYKGPPPTLYTPQQLAPPKQSPYYQPTAKATGDTVEVQPGETLYSIAQRHGVAVAAIKDANGLTSDSVRPGQRLVLPADAHDRTPVAKAPPALDRTAKYAPPAPPPAAQPVVEATPGWEGRYVMKNQDTLYGIALQHRVTLEELKRANGITDPTKVWAGRVLNVPSQSAPAVSQAPPQQQNTVPRIVQVPPRIINAAPEPAKVTPTAISPPPEAANAKFRWPVRGRIIAGFGKRPDGSHNDGVNVAVPQGTEIHAVDAGKVAYAGNELKGYGNLVLIRHANGWVSAYAHADQILVRPNDEVRRGQVIAKAGKTGAVDQPQVHFELRQGSRPVDPVPHLAN